MAEHDNELPLAVIARCLEELTAFRLKKESEAETNLREVTSLYLRHADGTDATRRGLLEIVRLLGIKDMFIDTTPEANARAVSQLYAWIRDRIDKLEGVK